MLLAGMIGNTLEWYDFAVYGYFAATIGRHFFPDDDPAVSVVAAFGVFAIGFLARPFGALIFGHLGDALGRRPVMVISITMMAVPTFLIGVLPSYATLGVMAPVLLVVLRLAQGISVGGEMTCSVTFMLEEDRVAKRRAFAGSWCFAGAVGGVLLGSAVGSLLTALLDEAQIKAWGWRLPFLAGAVIAIAGLVLRSGLVDGVTLRWRTGQSELPIVTVVRDHLGDMVRAIGITAFDAAGFYLMFVYVTTYLTQVAGESSAEAFDINTASMIVLTLAIPAGGWLADRYGVTRVAVLSTCAGALLSVPLFMLLDQKDPWLSLLGELGFVVILAPYIGSFGTRMALLFPTAVRMSGFSVSYNIGLAVFGGAAPLVASYLIERRVGDLSPGYLLAGAAAISLVSLLSARRAVVT